MCLDPFYVHDKGWIAAQRLAVGDQIELQSGEEAYVDAIEHEKLTVPIQVYNFEVEEFHTYYVGGACGWCIIDAFWVDVLQVSSLIQVVDITHIMFFPRIYEASFLRSGLMLMKADLELG